MVPRILKAKDLHKIPQPLKVQWESSTVKSSPFFLFHSSHWDPLRTEATMTPALSPTEICCHISRPGYLIISILKALLWHSPATKMSEKCQPQKPGKLPNPQQAGCYSRHANKVTLHVSFPWRKGLTQSPTGKMVFLSSWNYALQRLAVIRCMERREVTASRDSLLSHFLFAVTGKRYQQTASEKM